ncbi:MAG TPA: flagellar basal-body MS-ring/collar protein FliF [Desulfobacteria bacterium]|nr:flagellar basal-body MS-ring/collar protein FliF [Desulfobacteria bacterium]
MPFSWTGLRDYFQNLWHKLSTPQKFVLVAAPLVVAAALVYLISWANRPDYVPIFTKLSDSDAGAIVKKLQDLKVNYQLADNGSTIEVPKQQAAETRLDLASAGLPKGSKFSFDYLNQVQLGETDADRKLRNILALQDEMETTLKTMNGVDDARVSITMPDTSLFADQQKPTTASVTLKLTPGTTLSDDQVRAVANVLASSVEGLTPDKVTIVDTSGNVLSDVISSSNSEGHLSGTQMQMQQTVETSLRQSVQSMLDQVLGPGKTEVRANVTLDFDQIKITQQKNGPGAVVSEQDTTANTANVNQPGQNIYSYPQSTTTLNSVNGAVSSNNIQSTKNYQVDTTQEERVVSPGTIKRLTVSVLADSDQVTQNQLASIQGAVQSAVGFDSSRGDQVQVAAIPFDKSSINAEKAALAAAEQKQAVLNAVKIGAAVLLVIMVLVIIWRRRVAKRNAEFDDALQTMEEMASQVPVQEESVPVNPVPRKNQDGIDMQRVKDAVETFSRNNPEEVAKLVKAWIAEEN